MKGYEYVHEIWETGSEGCSLYEARDKQDAFEIANAIIGCPSNYYKDLRSSKCAGYPIYRSSDDRYNYFCDLGNRVEVNLHDGRTINILINPDVPAIYDDSEDPVPPTQQPTQQKEIDEKMTAKEASATLDLLKEIYSKMELGMEQKKMNAGKLANIANAAETAKPRPLDAELYRDRANLALGEFDGFHECMRLLMPYMDRMQEIIYASYGNRQ